MNPDDRRRRVAWMAAQRRAEEKIERAMLKHAVKGLALAFIALMSAGITISIKALEGGAPLFIVLLLITSLIGVGYSAARGLLLQRRLSKMKDVW